MASIAECVTPDPLDSDVFLAYNPRHRLCEEIST